MPSPRRPSGAGPSLMPGGAGAPAVMGGETSFRLPRRRSAIAVRSLVRGLVAPHGLMELKPR
jgi:hypothetical protein